MASKLRWSELDQGLETGDWPAWLPYGSCAIVTGATAIALLQRLDRPDRAPAIVALAVCYVPFLIDAIGYLTKRNVGLPLWLFPFPVLAGMTYLVLHPVMGSDVAPFILVFMSAEMVSRNIARTRRCIAVVAASCAVVALPDVLGITHGFSIWMLAVLFASGGGYLVQLLTDRTERLRQAQEGLQDKAAAEERSRIAREVHDVIAHSMSVTMLHITAARMALEHDKPDDALDALREAEQQGRTSMTEIRRTVGLLGDAGGAAPPMPGLGDLPKLVNDFCHAGLDVTLDMDGDATSLPPAAGLSLYRITQESLTNIAKHAPGASACVTLAIDDGGIRLEVRNPTNGHMPRSDGSGLGIRGMVERAAVLGGTLTAESDGDVWSVLLTAPR